MEIRPEYAETTILLASWSCGLELSHVVQQSSLSWQTDHEFESPSDRQEVDGLSLAICNSRGGWHPRCRPVMARGSQWSIKKLKAVHLYPLKMQVKKYWDIFIHWTCLFLKIINWSPKNSCIIVWTKDLQGLSMKPLMKFWLEHIFLIEFMLHFSAARSWINFKQG